jgi:hypothetical protein
MKKILSFCILLIGLSSIVHAQTYRGENQLLIIWHTKEGKEVVMHEEQAKMEINLETGQFHLAAALHDFVWLDSLHMPDSIDAHELLENLFRDEEIAYLSFNGNFPYGILDRQTDRPQILSCKGNLICGQLSGEIEIPLEVRYSDRFLFFNFSYSYSLDAFNIQWKDQYGTLLQDRVEIRVVSGKLMYD